MLAYMTYAYKLVLATLRTFLKKVLFCTQFPHRSISQSFLTETKLYIKLVAIVKQKSRNMDINVAVKSDNPETRENEKSLMTKRKIALFLLRAIMI